MVINETLVTIAGNNPATNANDNSTTHIDPSDVDAELNPFLLHHSFGPTNVLVTQSLTCANNYVSWSRPMLMALSSKNKSGFIDGTIKKPNCTSTA